MVLLQEQKNNMGHDRELGGYKSISEILAPGKGGLTNPWAVDSLVEGGQTMETK